MCHDVMLHHLEAAHVAVLDELGNDDRTTERIAGAAVATVQWVRTVLSWLNLEGLVDGNAEGNVWSITYRGQQVRQLAHEAAIAA